MSSTGVYLPGVAVSHPVQCLTGRAFVIAISISAARPGEGTPCGHVFLTGCFERSRGRAGRGVRVILIVLTHPCLNPPCPCSCASNPHFYLETTQPDNMVVVSLVQAEPDRNALPAIGFKVRGMALRSMRVKGTAFIPLLSSALACACIWRPARVLRAWSTSTSTSVPSLRVPPHPFGLQVLKKNGKRVRNVYLGEPVLAGPYVHSSEVGCRFRASQLVHRYSLPGDAAP
jgi:hypothetical protein